MFVILSLMNYMDCARFGERAAYCFRFDGVIVYPWGYIGIVQSTVPGLAHSIGLVHLSSPSAVNGDVKEVKVVITSNGEPIVDLVVVGCDEVRYRYWVIVLAQVFKPKLNNLLTSRDVTYRNSNYYIAAEPFLRNYSKHSILLVLV